MFRTFAACVLLLSMTAVSAAAPVASGPLSLSPAATVAIGDRLLRLNNGVRPLDAACCRRCFGGTKACGNSCIKRNYVCRRAPGCAC